MIDSDYSHIDMTMVAPSFVDAVSQSGRSRLGFSTQSVGRPLSGDWTAVLCWVYITAGVIAGLSLATVISCLGISQFMRWHQERELRDLTARVKSGKLFERPPAAP